MANVLTVANDTSVTVLETAVAGLNMFDAFLKKEAYKQRKNYRVELRDFDEQLALQAAKKSADIETEVKAMLSGNGEYAESFKRNYPEIKALLAD